MQVSAFGEFSTITSWRANYNSAPRFM